MVSVDVKPHVSFLTRGRCGEKAHWTISPPDNKPTGIIQTYSPPNFSNVQFENVIDALPVVVCVRSLIYTLPVGVRLSALSVATRHATINKRAAVPAAVSYSETETSMVRACHNHVPRHHGLSKTIFQGTLGGGRRRGRQRKCWMNDVKEWTSLPMPELAHNGLLQKRLKEDLR